DPVQLVPGHQRHPQPGRRPGRPPAPRARRRHRRAADQIAMMRARTGKQRWYTAVEVLSALTLLAIGAAGVIGMQRVTLQGSEDARRFDVGGVLAKEWWPRLQRDSTHWTQPNATVQDVNNINLTKFIGS